MKEKNILIFLVIAIAIVLIIIAFKTAERINKEYAQQKESDFIKINEDDGQGLPQIKPEDLEESEGVGAGGGSSGGAGGGIESTETQQNKSLPSDLYTRPCSFYFSEYGVCAGICPAGTCTQEGKSCYCK